MKYIRKEQAVVQTNNVHCT